MDVTIVTLSLMQCELWFARVACKWGTKTESKALQMNILLCIFNT
jgi:hypothetical protein